MELVLTVCAARVASRVCERVLSPFEPAVPSSPAPYISPRGPSRSVRRVIGILRCSDGRYLAVGSGNAVIADPSGRSGAARLFELQCPQGGAYNESATYRTISVRSLLNGQLLGVSHAGFDLRGVPCKATEFYYENGLLTSVAHPYVSVTFAEPSAAAADEVAELRAELVLAGDMKAALERARADLGRASHDLRKCETELLRVQGALDDEHEARVQSDAKCRTLAARLEESEAEMQDLEVELNGIRADEKLLREELFTLKNRVAMHEAKRGRSHYRPMAAASAPRAASAEGASEGITAALYHTPGDEKAAGYRVFSASASTSPATSGRTTPTEGLHMPSPSPGHSAHGHYYSPLVPVSESADVI